MSTPRTKRVVGALAATAAGGLMTLAFASPATAAGTGDWGAPGPDQVVQPGSSTSHELQTECVTAGGCDYGNAGLITATALDGATLSGLTSTTLWLRSGGVDLVAGTCQLNTSENRVLCEVTTSGHASQGEVLHSDAYTLNVPASTAPNTWVEQDHVASLSNDGDQTNDYWQYATPKVNDTPIADAGVAGGAIGGLALLGGGMVLFRRRKAAPAS